MTVFSNFGKYGIVASGSGGPSTGPITVEALIIAGGGGGGGTYHGGGGAGGGWRGLQIEIDPRPFSVVV